MFSRKSAIPAPRTRGGYTCLPRKQDCARGRSRPGLRSGSGCRELSGTGTGSCFKLRIDTTASRFRRASRRPSAFLQQGLVGETAATVQQMQMRAAAARPLPMASGNSATAAWQPLGPEAVASRELWARDRAHFGHRARSRRHHRQQVYVGTTGGGVWVSQNAGTSTANRCSSPPSRTRRTGRRARRVDQYWCRTVQPGGTGVILAGTGDPNDALDSYYGAGILRSTDGGNSWSLIQTTADQTFTFPARVLRDLHGARRIRNWLWPRYRGLRRHPGQCGAINAATPDFTIPMTAGATWSLARITDGAGGDVQGPRTCLPPAWKCGNRRRLESCAAVVHCGGAFSRLLPIGRWHYVDAHGGSTRERA